MTALLKDKTKTSVSTALSTSHASCASYLILVGVQAGPRPSRVHGIRRLARLRSGKDALPARQHVRRLVLYKDAVCLAGDGGLAARGRDLRLVRGGGIVEIRWRIARDGTPLHNKDRV